MLIARKIAPLLQQYLTIFSAVAITGPRQSGKSTLLKSLLPDYTYVTFDDEDNRQLFYQDPKGFLKRYPHKIIFDEAQKVPEIFERIKIEIDNDRSTKGKFVLSGSSQFVMFRQVTESLAGRIGLLELLPLCYQEMPESLHEASIYQGSYPEPVTQNFIYNAIWYKAYLQTYLEKDVRDLIKITNLTDFRRFIGLVAARATTTLSLTNLANDLGVSSHTVKQWLSVLEASYIIFFVQPYYNNLGKRIIKSPKIYFWDTGLVAHLTKITSKDLYEHGPMSGQLFENYVISEIAKSQKHTLTPANLYYFRTNHGVEIDLIIDRGAEQDFIEIKKSYSYQSKMTSALQELSKTLSSKSASVTSVQSYLLYQGESVPSGGHQDLHIWHYADYLKKD